MLLLENVMINLKILNQTTPARPLRRTWGRRWSGHCRRGCNNLKKKDGGSSDPFVLLKMKGQKDLALGLGQEQEKALVTAQALAAVLVAVVVQALEEDQEAVHL